MAISVTDVSEWDGTIFGMASKVSLFEIQAHFQKDQPASFVRPSALPYCHVDDTWKMKECTIGEKQTMVVIYKVVSIN